MKVLIKLGGTLLDEPASLARIAEQLGAVAAGHQLVVVHGGGKQVTRHLAERGVTSQFVRGLRVSDATVIQAVMQVIAGSVNKQLVARLVAAGVPAVGVSGVDGGLTSAVVVDPELQFVGRPVKTESRLLDLLLSASYTPVIACLAGDRDGNVYNVNADSMAVSCAVGWGADRLLFLTDVAGVKDGAGSVLPELTAESVAELIESGVAHGGMQAKLDAARAAVDAGIDVQIASGGEPQVMTRLLGGESLGTAWWADHTLEIAR